MTIGGRGERGIFGEKLARVIAALCFAYLLFLPVSQGQLLLVMFGLMVLTAALTILNTMRALTLPIAGIAATTLLLGLYGLLIGADNPGFTNAAGIFVGAPLLFFFVISALGHGSVKALLTTAAIMTVVSGLYILIYVAGAKGYLPQVIPTAVLEITGAGIGEKGDATAIRFYGLSTLAASAPMWVTSLFVGKDDLLPGTRLRVAAAVAGVAGAVVGGRRAIVLTLLIIPVIAWLVKRATRPKRTGPRTIHPGYMIAGLIAVAAGAIYAPRILAAPIVANTLQATTAFFTGTSYSEATDQSIRTEQVDRLLSAWTEAPVTGHGLGAIIIGYQRSDAQPWQFEAQYPALLMQTGLIGAVLVLVMATLICVAVFKASRARPDLVPSLVVTLCGGIAMLIANATNPYLQAPAHMWAIFLPLAVLNVILREPAGQLPDDMERADAAASPGLAGLVFAAGTHQSPQQQQPLNRGRL